MPSGSRPALLLLAIALLTGCAQGPEPPEDPEPYRQAALKAYEPAIASPGKTVDETWIIEGRGLDVTLARPDLPGPLPVVVYLPGLGETRHAGAQWREAWAHAGYAVLSVQPLVDDATAWQSDLARDGDFRGLGRRHFAPQRLPDRLRVLDEVIEEARRRSGQAGWRQLDWSVVALAGYDLGAYSAMVAGGEQAGMPVPPLPVGIRAIVTLSPFAATGGPEPAARYRDIRVPVLAVTGEADTDALGLMPRPEQRLVPFDNLVARPAWLLDLEAMPHAAFAGNASYEAARANAARAEWARNNADGMQRQRAASRPRSNDYGEDRFGPGGSSNRSRPAPGAGRDAPVLGRLALRWRVEVVREVSTAFLDATVRGDARARAWLAGNAAQRLAGVGTLKGR